jgi:transcriptional regulator with XRE-family HTH domain
MTSVEFKAWRERLGFSQQAAAEALGLSKSSIELYERGSRRDDGRPVDIPTTVELSCKYLAQQARLRHQLDMLESGKMTLRENRGMGTVDVTQEWSQELRKWLSDLDAALASIRPVMGGYRLVEIEFGDYGQLLHRRVIDRLATRKEAEDAAARTAKEKAIQTGFNDEHGYWWCRDVSIGKAYRYIIEAAD